MKCPSSCRWPRSSESPTFPTGAPLVAHLFPTRPPGQIYLQFAALLSSNTRWRQTVLMVDRAHRELQERCQRLVARLPTVPSDPCSSSSEEVTSQGAPSAPGSTEALLSPGRGGALPSRLSLDSRLSTKVLVPRQHPQQQQQQQHTASSSRQPASVNPFDLARSEDGMSVEVIEEDEMEFMVEEVTTPGGTVREVVVHESSSEIPSAAMALKARARSEETPSQSTAAGDAAADEPLGAAGQQLEFRVASVNDPAETEAAPNPFAFARATDAVAATANIVQPLPAKRRQGSLGMAREDLLSRVGNAPDLATAALGPGAAVQGTVFLDPLGSGSLAGSEASGSLGRLEVQRSAQHSQEQLAVGQGSSAKAAAAVAGEAVVQGTGAADRQEEGRRASRDSRQSSAESDKVSANPVVLSHRPVILRVQA